MSSPVLRVLRRVDQLVLVSLGLRLRLQYQIASYTAATAKPEIFHEL